MPKVLKEAQADVKAECKPLGSAVLYVLCCVAWICVLPVVIAGAVLKDLVKKLKPAEKKAEEPAAPAAE
jgi:hypothetical protein